MLPVQSPILVKSVDDPYVPSGQIYWVLKPVFRGQKDPRGHVRYDVVPYGQYDPAGQFLHFVCPY